MSHTPNERKEAIEAARGAARAELDPYGGVGESDPQRAQGYALIAVSLALEGIWLQLCEGQLYVIDAGRG